MTRTHSLLILCLFATVAHALQDTAAPPEPEYRDQYTVFADGRLVPLERETAIVGTQSKRNFVITPSVTSFQTVRGATSPVRVSGGAHFFVRLNIGDQDPATLIHLRKLVPGKDDRRMPYMTIRGSLVPFTGPKQERPPDDSIPFTVRKYGASSLEIIPNVPLAPGEYAFVNANQAQCFGVDAGSSPATDGSSTAQPQRPLQAVNTPAPVWRLQPLGNSNPDQQGGSAVLSGTVEVKGRRFPSRLSIGCTVVHYTGPNPPTGDLRVQLLIPRPLSVQLTGDFTCEGDGATGSPSLYTEIGSTHIPVRNACFDDDATGQPTPGTPLIEVGLTYEPAVVSSILGAAGQILAVHIRTETDKADNLVARFSLPQQNSAVQELVTPCIDLLNAARQREKARIVAACPVMDGATLSGMDVVSGPGNKKVAPDPDNDIGTAWIFSTVRKSKQPAPKRLLLCSYTDSGKSALPKKMLPIPATATTCVYRSDEYTNELYGNCVR